MRSISMTLTRRPSLRSPHDLPSIQSRRRSSTERERSGCRRDDAGERLSCRERDLRSCAGYVDSGCYVMQENRTGATASLLLNGNVLAAGGITGSRTLKSAEILDPVTHAFTKIADMNVGRNQHSATLLDDGRVLIAAGSTDFVFLKSAEIFDPNDNSFTLTGSLLDPPGKSGARKSHTDTLLPGRKSPSDWRQECQRRSRFG